MRAEFHEPIGSKRLAMGEEAFGACRIVTLLRNPYAAAGLRYAEIGEAPGAGKETGTSGGFESFGAFLDWYAAHEKPFASYLLDGGRVPPNLTVIRGEWLDEEAGRVLNGEWGLGIDLTAAGEAVPPDMGLVFSRLSLKDIDRLNEMQGWTFDRFYPECRLGTGADRPVHGAALRMIAEAVEADGKLSSHARRIDAALLAGQSPVPAMAGLIDEIAGGGDFAALERILACAVECWSSDLILAKAFFAALQALALAVPNGAPADVAAAVVDRVAVECLLPDCPQAFAGLALKGTALPAAMLKRNGAMVAMCRRWAASGTKGIALVATMLEALWQSGLRDEIAGMIVAAAENPLANPKMLVMRTRLAQHRGEDLGALQPMADAMDLKAKGAAQVRSWFAAARAAAPPAQGPGTLMQDGLERITALDLGGLAAVLAPLAETGNAPLLHKAPPEVADIEAAAKTIMSALTEGGRGTSVAEELRVAAVLHVIAEDTLREYALRAETTPYEHSPKYGTLDVARCKAAFDLFMLAVAVLARQALARLAPGDAASRRHAVVLLAAAAARLEACKDAIPVIEDALAAAPDPSFQEWMALERCHLALADIEGAAGARLRGRLGPASIHPLLRFSDWAAAEKLPDADLFEDAAENGSFQYCGSDGLMRRHPHSVLAARMHATRLSGLKVMDGRLLTGPSGHILRPADHVQFGEYPPPGPSVINRVSGRHVAAAVALPRRWMRVVEPVLVFDDPVPRRDYASFVLEFLSRAAWAEEHGLAENRKLLVSGALQPWMRDALELAGFGAERLHVIAAAEAAVFEDALVMSSTDVMSRSLFDALRQRLWRMTGTPIPKRASNSRFLFLSGPGDSFGEFIGKAGVEQAAAEAGFEIVCPEEMSMPEQVKLFASAAGIAGFEGPAFANQIFAPDHIRTLGIWKEEDNDPAFINLSLLGAQERRVIGGAAPSRCLVQPLLAPHYVLNMAQVRAGLAWVKNR